MTTKTPFSELVTIANEAFGAINLARRHYGSSDAFQIELERVVKVLREQARAVSGGGRLDGEFLQGIADALERWNSGSVSTK